jgi:hypothetical protein
MQTKPYLFTDPETPPEDRPEPEHLARRGHAAVFGEMQDKIPLR